MKSTCPFCGKSVGVVDPRTAAPFFKKHRVGKAADLRGGQVRHTTCEGSLMAAKVVATQRALICVHLCPSVDEKL